MLAYSPLVFMIAYLLYNLYIKFLLNYLRKKFHKKHPNSSLELSVSILDQDREVEMSQCQSNYQKVD